MQRVTAKKLSRKSVNRIQWRQYFESAAENYSGVLCNYKAGLWTPTGILIVHSVIAYTDALTVKAGGVKSAGDDHLQLVELVKQVISLSKDDKTAMNRLVKILSEKSKVAYGGKVYSKKQVDIMMKNFDRYRSWVIGKIDSIE